MLDVHLQAGHRLNIVIYDGESTIEAKWLFDSLLEAVKKKEVVDIGLRDLVLSATDVYSGHDMNPSVLFDSLRILMEGTLVAREPVVRHIVKLTKKENVHGPT